MSEQSRKHLAERIAERAAAGIAALSIILAAIIHIINFLPDAYSTLFPRHDIRVLGFNSQERIVVANRGDYDYFISHVRYGPDYSRLGDYNLVRAATAFSQDSLPGMCEKYFEEIAQDKATDNCEERLKNATLRVDRVAQIGEAAASAKADADAGSKSTAKSASEDRDGLLGVYNPMLWSPGFKNRGIAAALNSGTTDQFEIEDTKWQKCPVVDSATDEQWKSLVALWLAAYQTIPGRCLNLEYYYEFDRNFIALQGRHDELRTLTATGSLQYYSMSERDEGANDDCWNPASTAGNPDPDSKDNTNSVKAACLKQLLLPKLVGVMRYNDSKFCTQAIREIAWFNKKASSKPKSCLGDVK